MIVPLNACDLMPLATLKNYPKQSFSIIYSIYDHLLIREKPHQVKMIAQFYQIYLQKQLKEQENRTWKQS